MQQEFMPLITAGGCALLAWFLLRTVARRIRIVLVVTVFLCAWVGVVIWQSAREPVQTADGQDVVKLEQELRQASLSELAPLHPRQSPDDGYLSSQACLECHPDNHRTWSASYHRTMTQVATPEAVFGDFDDKELEWAGQKFQLQQRNGVCWVEMDRPAGEGRVEVPIVMTTGSHHMQVYWYPTGQKRVIKQLPLVYLKDPGRWIPRDSSFLQPPSVFGAETGNWNQSCINCHTTHGKPRPDGAGAWDSEVGEFGISCEACHGPGKRHVELHRNSSSVDPDEDPIVNPANLSNHLSSQVCGQCHGFTLDLNDPIYLDAQQNGRPFRPGDELSETRHILQTNEASRKFLEQYIGDEVEEYLLGQFWTDGMVRVTGREYNGVSESACFQRGELSCLSCHLLHKKDDPRPLTEWTDDLLQPGMRGDDGCLQCHAASDYGPLHTHHVAESSGSRCYNCHMPHTTYGLLKAIRSHKITSPSVLDDIETGRPNACNLCHLDKTLAWSADHLNDWYGLEKPDLDEDQKTIAGSLLTLLRGDAGQRALLAWNMSWQPAIEVSGADWQAPFLACLFQDPYDAVRFIAYESLQRLPGFADFPFDFVAAEGDRLLARDQAIQLWLAGRVRNPGRYGPELLIDASRGLQVGLVNRLLNERDNRAVNLAE